MSSNDCPVSLVANKNVAAATHDVTGVGKGVNSGS